MNNNPEIAIVVITYNRPNSLQRLLNFINESYFDDDRVDLIISIDFSGAGECENVAKSFEWSHGAKIINAHQLRLGLKKHILSCGNYLESYDAIIVLEDDLIVSPSFYLFARACVAKYQNDPRIAGISLYPKFWNVDAGLPFEPDDSGKDAFFIKLAQSWGQVWLKNAWNAFALWMQDNDNEVFDDYRIPNYVKKWPKSSWLKHHIRYCIVNNLYFVYPYRGFSSNCSEIGEHNSLVSNSFQTSLVFGKKERFDLPDFNCETIKYDQFLERESLLLTIDGDTLEAECDLYGTKSSYDYKYVITNKALPYHVIKKYGLVVRPQERNILLDISGDCFFLYDISIDRKDGKKKSRRLSTLPYYFRFDYAFRTVFKYFTGMIKAKIHKKKK